MLDAGVPCIAGYQGSAQDDSTLQREADAIGYPLMIKASAGGGGRGMRLVQHPEELLDNLHTARSEAKNAFGSGELILEQALIDPRHVEIQLFGDSHGHLIYLGERDCSIQFAALAVDQARADLDDFHLRHGPAAFIRCGFKVNNQPMRHRAGSRTLPFLMGIERSPAL
jgi:pyruvate carboxylase